MIGETTKKALRIVLPKWARIKLGRLKVKILGMEYEYRDLSAEGVFNKIYKYGAWGKDEQGNSISGAGSHAEEIVRPYIEEVSKFLSALDNPTVVDLGCGDFNVGRQLNSYAGHYIACDISTLIIEKNKRNYKYDNVEFLHINIIDDELPSGDVAFIRQVLQHLSNDDIMRFVKRINEGSFYRYLLVTEHLPLDPNFVPNIDKSKGPGIRVTLNSGVDLAKEPFNLRFLNKKILFSVNEEEGGIPAQILTTLYELRS